MDTLKCNRYSGKAVLCQTIGGPFAGMIDF